MGTQSGDVLPTMKLLQKMNISNLSFVGDMCIHPNLMQNVLEQAQLQYQSGCERSVLVAFILGWFGALLMVTIYDRYTKNHPKLEKP